MSGRVQSGQSSSRCLWRARGTAGQAFQGLQILLVELREGFRGLSLPPILRAIPLGFSHQESSHRDWLKHFCQHLRSQLSEGRINLHTPSLIFISFFFFKLLLTFHIFRSFIFSLPPHFHDHSCHFHSVKVFRLSS